MEKKTLKLHTMTRTVSDDVISEHILPRLPVKSLLRFKSVSKGWKSTISSPKFSKSHFKFNSSSIPQFLIYKQKDFFLLPYDEGCDNVKELVKLPFRRQSRHVDLVGSANGLVCLYLESGYKSKRGRFALWNPATRERQEIDIPDDIGFATAYGFAYASSLDDYKIVAYRVADYTYKTAVYFHVFSWRAGTWKKIHMAITPGKVLNKTAVVVNDIFYWGDYAMSSSSDIVAFNIVTERLELKPLMNLLKGYSWRSWALLFKVKDCLSLSCVTKPAGIVDIWILKKQDDWNSWEKVSCIDRHTGFMYFSNTGKCLVQDRECFKLANQTQVAIQENNDRDRDRDNDSDSDSDHVYDDLYCDGGLTESSDEYSDPDCNALEATDYVASLISPNPKFYEEDENHGTQKQA